MNPLKRAVRHPMFVLLNTKPLKTARVNQRQTDSGDGQRDKRYWRQLHKHTK